ncbi:MAG: choice-of-anchor E domain-containing protein [Kiritimatiellales bacterium]
MALMAGLASAAIESFSVNYSEGNPIWSTPYNMTLSQFDTQSGTRVLSKVTLTFTAQQSADINFENGTDSAFDGSPALAGAQVALTGTGAINLSSALNISGIPAHSFAANGAESGLPTYNGTGGDYFSFGNIESDLYTGIVEKTSDFSPFLGTGLISYDMTSLGTWILSGGGDAQSTVSQYLTSGTLKVDYTYSPIPEPATASMTVLVLIAGFWIRRRFID